MPTGLPRTSRGCGEAGDKELGDPKQLRQAEAASQHVRCLHGRQSDIGNVSTKLR
jgi:hypothetical protein